MPENDSHIIVAILVADLVGSSNFIGSQKDQLFRIYHDQIDHLFKQGNYQNARLKSETAGDGVHIVFSDPVIAGNYALDLSNFIENYDWRSCGIHTKIGIRIALHSGIVFKHSNPVTHSYDYSGHTHDLASRLEPVTAVNEVFVSQGFAAQCSLRPSNLYLMPAGKRPLKKSAGSKREYFLYRLCRRTVHCGNHDWDEHAGTQLATFRTEADWSWLLSMLHAHRVIPVIGPELLRIKIEQNGVSHECNLYDYAVKQLANELGVYYSENMSFVDIFDLCYKQYRNQTEIRFKDLIDDLTRKWNPPEILRKLVEMKCFPGFIVTTPDSFLKKTLKEVFCSAEDDSWMEDWEFYVGEKEFKGKDLSDISAHPDTLSVDSPFIFHIFGMLNSHSDFYAVTENDMLMFARAWNQNAPKNLKNYLQGHEENERKVILMLGCNYDNWYARLFLFNLSVAPTCASLHKDCGIVADSISRNDTAFGTFLSRDNFGKIFYDGNAADFINLMSQKFSSRQQQGPEWRPVSGVAAIASSPEDADKAKTLHEQLKSVHFNVKLVRENELNNPQRLAMILANAALLIPIISPRSDSLNDLIQAGLEENKRRKEKCGKDYFLMPLFIGEIDTSRSGAEFPADNCLRMASDEDSLNKKNLERVYRNLCVHEEGKQA